MKRRRRFVTQDRCEHNTVLMNVTLCIDETAGRPRPEEGRHPGQEPGSADPRLPATMGWRRRSKAKHRRCLASGLPVSAPTRHPCSDQRVAPSHGSPHHRLLFSIHGKRSWKGVSSRQSSPLLRVESEKRRFTRSELAKLRVLRFGFFQGRKIGVGVFPKGEEVLV